MNIYNLLLGIALFTGVFSAIIQFCYEEFPQYFFYINTLMYLSSSLFLLLGLNVIGEKKDE